MGDNGDPMVHRRTITYEVSTDDSTMRVDGHLVDERPWADGTEVRSLQHDLFLRVAIGLADLVITEAAIEMRAFPHTECPEIEPAFAGLVGVSVGRGFTKEVQRRVAGVHGCTHLDQVARGLGPAVMQSLTSHKARQRVHATTPADYTPSPWVLGTCHIWEPGGIAQQKLEAGWSPGRGEYPAPALVELRRRNSR
ncbi:MAG: DUF2889 domain-containing protein [Ilumatobacteraceae bacterium]